MDIVLAVLPWKFLWVLQVKRKEKIGVIMAMRFGLIAGAMAIAKSTELPTVVSADFAETLALWYWGNAKIFLSIIAASVPMLRVLVCDVKSLSRGYHGGCYVDKDTVMPSNHSRFVTITSRARPAPTSSVVELHKLGDDRSDRSILGKTVPGHSGNGIIQVTEITVKYNEDAAERK
ncbi:hypothetical protein VTI74DRAFT_4406 [Chaetomium olivicolor]